MHRLLIATVLCSVLAPAVYAAESGGEEGEGAIGYGGPRVQLTPIMAPYQTSNGVQYEVLTVRLQLPEGEERPGCWMIPIVHEKILIYLYNANLTQADFRGQRREVLRKNLFDEIIRQTDRSLYTNLTLVDANSEPITPETDPRSATLTNQCK